MYELGSVTSTSSRVKRRVLRSPILTTRPRSPESRMMKSPILYGASLMMKIPPNKLASESLAAKLPAIPTIPAEASQGARSRSHVTSNQ